MSRFTDYLALILAVAIVVLLVRGPIDWDGFATAWKPAVDAVVAEDVAMTEPAVPSIAIDMTQGDVLAGAETYQRICGACHSTKPGQAGAGPSLFGIVGAPAAAQEGFSYSAPMQASGIVWTPDALASYLSDPRAFLPGTSMAFVGVTHVQDITDIVAYLDAISVN